MQSYPHHYRVTASAESEENVSLTSGKLEPISSAPPVEFDGPGDLWSPEELLVAAIADCFILSFRGVARAGRLAWISLECEVEGTLARLDGKTQFTEYKLNVSLHLPRDTNEEKAHRLLEKAEAGCLVTNSLTGPTQLVASVSVKP